MKRILSIIALLFVLLTTIVLASHFFPEKVPKKVATFLPMEYYKKIPRQVREYFPWLKPNKPETQSGLNAEALNQQIEQFQQEEASKKKVVPQGQNILLQAVLDDFYQALAENQFRQAYDLLSTVSQKSLSGENFQNYYFLKQETFLVTKSLVTKNITAINSFKEPISGKIIDTLYKAKVIFDATDVFSTTKSLTEKVTQYVYFTKEKDEWKIVELDINNKSYNQKRFYHFVNEGYKRFENNDTFSAIEYFRKAIKLNDLSLNAHYGLSVALYSIAYYDATITTVQKMASIYHKKYITKIVTDQIDLKALKKLDKERLSNGYYIMAMALIKKGNLPAAKDTLFKSLALAPNNKFSIGMLKTIPRSIVAKPAPTLYTDVGEKEDPFRAYKDKMKGGSQKPLAPVFDPKKSLDLLNSAK